MTVQCMTPSKRHNFTSLTRLRSRPCQRAERSAQQLGLRPKRRRPPQLEHPAPGGSWAPRFGGSPAFG
eukprot:7556128-Alexandrium_andersonii.AAC.1